MGSGRTGIPGRSNASGASSDEETSAASSRSAPGKRTLTERLSSPGTGVGAATGGEARTPGKAAQEARPADGAKDHAPEPGEQAVAAEEGADAGGGSFEIAKQGEDGEASSQDGMHKASQGGGGQAAASGAPEREFTLERMGRGGVAQARAIASQNPSDFPDHLGLTTVRYGSAAVGMTGTVRGSTYRIKFKRAATPSLTFPVYIAAPAGTTAAGNVQRDNSAGQSKTVALKYVVTPAIHTEIVTAEGEHYSDYQRAFQLSLRAGVDAVNALSTQTFTGPSQQDAVDQANAALAGRLHARLGSDPATWGTVMQELVDLSPPARDATGSHTWRWTEAAVDWATNSVTRTFDSNPTVGTVPSTTVVNL